MSRALLVASLALLASCVKSTPVEVPAPAPAPAPVVPREPRIVDICVHESNDPVCVLRDDGRVWCAHIDDDHFAPPLAGITNAVELSCGNHAICVREADGAITCLDRTGALRVLDSLPGARSLARDCAVSQAGELHCWDHNLEISERTFPKLSATLGHDDAHSLDLQRAALDQYGSDGCVLRRDGDLWCWGLQAADSDLPELIANLGRAEDIRELKIVRSNACWRSEAAWICTDGKSPPAFAQDCDHHPCTCTFAIDSCESHAQFPPDHDTKPFETVDNVVLADRKCVVDLLDRVWCQSWQEQPVHELVLAPTSETTAQLEPIERQPPTPEPMPLPDPEQSDCPEATRVSNRVCEHLTEPGGLLACKPGARACPRRCDVSRYSDQATGCGPEGFAIASIGGSFGIAEYALYVDGPQVWLGPRLNIGVEDLRGTMPVMIEQHRFGDDGGSYWAMDYELTTQSVCGLVDQRPRCSAPIVQNWEYDEVVWDDYSDNDHFGEETSREKIRYEADIAATSTEVKVKVRTGKRHANTEHQNVEGMRVLPTGTHALEELLDQPFVYLPE